MKKLLYLSFSLVVICGLFFPICFAQTKDDPNAPKDRDNTSEQGVLGMKLWWECLNWVWKGCFEYEKIIWINNESKKYTALSIVQDVIYAATYMVWTVLTAVIIWCWLWYILASRWGKDTNAYKKWLTNGAIWAILVLWAYTIVRLIQYIAKW